MSGNRERTDHYVFKNRVRRSCHLKPSSVEGPGEVRMVEPMVECDAS